MKYRFVFFPLTGALTILGLALFLHRGEAGLNVDFRGGTVFAGQLKEGEERGLITTDDGKPGFRELLSEENQKKRLHADSCSLGKQARVRPPIANHLRLHHYLLRQHQLHRNADAEAGGNHRRGDGPRRDRSRVASTGRVGRADVPFGRELPERARAGTSPSARPRSNPNSFEPVSIACFATRTGIRSWLGRS